MKPKIAIPILVLALLAVLWLLLNRQPGAPLSDPATRSEDKNSADATASALLSARALDSETRSNSLAGTAVAPELAKPSAAGAAAAHETYVTERVSELGDLGMADDSASLDTILSELTNRDPEIRKAAVEAAVQFGSRDAIPKLADAALQTDDAHEKAALTDAIEFLKLPSLSEVEAQSRTQGTVGVKSAGTKATFPKPAKRTTGTPAPE